MKSKRTFIALALGLAWSVSACSGNTLSEPRDQTTATLLPDGDVLVAGGARSTQFLWTGGTKALTSADRYNPESGTWTPTGAMAAGRYAHTATLLPSGKVLVAGGFSWSEGLNMPLSTPTAELYDPENGSWSRTGPMSRGRAGHQATLLADGRVLVTGGALEYAPNATAEVYDPEKGVWLPIASMGTARGGHSATLLPEGTVLVAGGMDDRYRPLDTAEVYDPVANTWSPTGSMSNAKTGHVATPLPHGKVLVTGAKGLSSAYPEVYEPATGTWSSAGTRPKTYFESHTATLLPDGRVLLAGGHGLEGSAHGVLGNTAVYVPETHEWTTSSPLPEPRTGHSAVLLRDGRVLVVGGSTLKDNFYGPLDTSVTYDPGTNTWK